MRNLSLLLLELLAAVATCSGKSTASAMPLKPTKNRASALRRCLTNSPFKQLRSIEEESKSGGREAEIRSLTVIQQTAPQQNFRERPEKKGTSAALSSPQSSLLMR